MLCCKLKNVVLLKIIDVNLYFEFKMKILSLNVGQPQQVEWEGEMVTTSIFKSSVPDKRAVSFLNIEGDRQSDLRYHGGVDKAIYSYDISYYEHWKNYLQREDWSAGLFGENLTTQNMPDEAVHIGNIYTIGTTTLQAIQPRFPCYKVNVRFNLPDMIERFYVQRRHGTYFRVLEEGHIQTGDAIELIEMSPFAITIQDVTECFITKGKNRAKLNEILEIPYLPASLQNVFRRFVK